MFLGTVRSEVQDQKETNVKLVVVINISLFFMHFASLITIQIVTLAKIFLYNIMYY